MLVPACTVKTQVVKNGGLLSSIIWALPGLVTKSPTSVLMPYYLWPYLQKPSLLLLLTSRSPSLSMISPYLQSPCQSPYLQGPLPPKFLKSVVYMYKWAKNVSICVCVCVCVCACACMCVCMCVCVCVCVCVHACVCEGNLNWFWWVHHSNIDNELYNNSDVPPLPVWSTAHSQACKPNRACAVMSGFWLSFRYDWFQWISSDDDDG